MNLSATGVAALLVFCFVAIRNEAASLGAASPPNDVPLDPQSAFDVIQKSWRREFAKRGDRYIDAQMTPYREQVESACGSLLAPGAYYCALDRTLYFDLALDETLRTRLDRGADRVRMHIIAHELGHHVQSLRGVSLGSPQLELHADCLAGMSLGMMGEIDKLELGDIESATQIPHADSARIHGAAAQRLAALHRGQQSKSLSDCEESVSR